MQSVRACGEGIETLENFTYLGSVLHNDNGSSQYWPGPQHHGFAQHEYLVLSVSVQMNKDSDLQVASDPCLILWL